MNFVKWLERTRTCLLPVCTFSPLDSHALLKRFINKQAKTLHQLPHYCKCVTLGTQIDKKSIKINTFSVIINIPGKNSHA